MKLYQDDFKVVKEYFLINSSADVIQSFIEEAICSGKKISDVISSDCESQLLKRNEPVINLVLARYGHNREIFEKLYQNAPQAIKISLLSNPNIFTRNETSCKYQENPELLALNHSWMNLSHVENLLSEKNALQLFAFFRNRYIDTDLLNDLYDKIGIFEKIDDKLWCSLVDCSTENKKIYDFNPYNHVDFEKIWNLAARVIVNKEWAETLHVLLSKIPKWADSDYDIRKVLDRWSIADEEKLIDHDYCTCCEFSFCNPFEEVRICIASLNHDFSKKSAYLYPKIFEAISFRNFSIKNIEELEKIYKNQSDKSLFLRNIVRNKWLFENNEIRETIKKLCQHYDYERNTDKSYEFSFDCAYDLYKKINPEWFHEKEEPSQIEKIIIQRCEIIDKKIQEIKDFFCELGKHINIFFLVIVYPALAYYLVITICKSYKLGVISTFMGIFSAIITLIIILKKIIKKEIEKKATDKLPAS